MTSPSDFYVTLQESMIGAYMNAALMLQFMMGLYTGVYAATIYIYSSFHCATSSKKRLVMGTLTILYGTIMAQVLLGWYFIANTFGIKGDSRLSIFIQSAQGVSTSPTLSLMSILLQSVGFLLADGLMIWRCFPICGQSYLRFALPATLGTIEFALAIINVAFNALTYFKPSFETIQRVQHGDTISGALYASVAATSIASTFALCHHIYANTTCNKPCRQRYRHIVDILIQSSAAYTIVAFMSMVCSFLVTGEVEPSTIKILIINNYLVSLSVIMAGLSPTVMVARLAIISMEINANEMLSDSLPSSLSLKCWESGDYSGDSNVERGSSCTALQG